MMHTYSMKDGRMIGGVLNAQGQTVTRTKSTHPYSYDPFLLWRKLPNEMATGGVYTDRLSQWDYELNNRLKRKHFESESDYYSQFTPEQVESFLQERLEKPMLKVVYMEEHCNVATGYPVWYIAYAGNEENSENE